MRASKKGFLTLLGLLLAIVIIFFLWYTTYLKRYPASKSTGRSLSGQDTDTPSRLTILDSTRERIKNINRQILNREK